MAWIEFLYPPTISALTLGANVALAVCGHRPRRPGSPTHNRSQAYAVFATCASTRRIWRYRAVQLASETSR